MKRGSKPGKPPTVEKWGEKLVLVLPVLAMRNHFAEAIGLMTDNRVDIIELTKRGRPIAHMVKPKPRHPPPLPPHPAKPPRLRVGQLTFSGKQ